MSLLTQFNHTLVQVQVHVPLVLFLIGIVWAIQIVNMILGYRLNRLGIFPRHLFGLSGVICCPLLHGSINHIFMNSFFFFPLALIVLIKGKLAFWVVTSSITVISGMFIWLFGRNAIHVGASALVVGYWSYSVATAYLTPNMANIAGAILGMFYFGADLLGSMLPQGKNVSFEGHIAGFIAGGITAYQYSKLYAWLAPSLVWLLKYA
ncbi:MAG: rhomboid family intramembrane serine protease [Pseudomonadota bacterium]|nr:rhomboid family intramembrane serine protease [Pseudomonadota bacterium]